MKRAVIELAVLLLLCNKTTQCSCWAADKTAVEQYEVMASVALLLGQWMQGRNTETTPRRRSTERQRRKDAKTVVQVPNCPRREQRKGRCPRVNVNVKEKKILKKQKGKNSEPGQLRLTGGYLPYGSFELPMAGLPKDPGLGSSGHCKL